MGNAFASGSSPSSMDSAKLGVPDPRIAPQLSNSEAESDEKQKRGNPGTIEELHKKCKDLQALTFEGAKILLNKGLSNHFQVSHTLNICSTQPSGYRFGVTYVGTRQYSPNEAYPVLLGDIDSSGNLNANIINQFHPRVRCKFASQILDSSMTAAQLTTDYRGDDYTASLTVVNPNVFKKSGIVVGHFLQSVTPNVDLGAELAYQCGPSVPGGKVAIFSLAGRYTHGDSIWSGTAGIGGFHLCYYQKASEQLQIGVEVETSLRMQESIATIGYQIDLPKADLVFRGSLDSNWTVCGVLEKRLQPLPFSFALSGRLNHSKNQFKLGVGLIIG